MILRIGTIVVLGVLALGVQQSHAAIIASDQFLVGGSGYSSGNLNGQGNTNGTQGYFTGATGGNPAPAWSSGTSAFSAQATGLTHPYTANPPVSGDGKVFAAGNANPRIQYRDFASLTPVAANNYYFSLLLNESSNSYTGTVYAGVGESRAAGGNASTLTTGFNIGYLNGALSLFYNNGGAAYATQTLLSTPAVNSTYLVTVDYNVAAGTLTPTVYDALGTVVNTPTAVNATMAPNHMGAFQMFVSTQFNAGSPAVVNFDEFRFGTALTDVISIPEPSTWMLLSGLTIGLCGLRRRA
jgi:hypothetical protein